MYELKKIDVVSFAKVKAVILGAIMFIVGVVYVVLALIAFFIRSSFGTTLYEGTGIGYSVGTGLLILIFGTILGIVCGFILGAILAAIYNLMAGKIGGIRVNLNQVSFKETNNLRKNNNKKNNRS